MMYSRQPRDPRKPRTNTDPQNTNEGGSDNSSQGNREDSRTDNRQPDNRPPENRAPYGNRDNNRPSYGNRDNNRPSYGGDRPAYGNRDNNRPSYGNRDTNRPASGNDRPAYGNRDNNRPSYGGGGGGGDRDNRPPYQNRDSRPSYGNRDSNRPAYGGGSGGGDRPPYQNRDSRPPYQNRDNRPSYGDRDNRPPYQNRDSRPSYGDRDRRPSYGDRDRRPSYGDRDRRPAYGDRRGGPSRGPMKDNRISLPRAIARLGYTSRNLAIAIIKDGRVRVDDRVVTNPSVRLTPMRNNLYVDDILINIRHARTYIIMHKPKGLVTSREESLTRKTLYNVLPNKQEWNFPVGRLDKNTSGLLILTNDSHISNPETSPFVGVEKTYNVKLNKAIAAPDLKKLTTGVTVEKGTKLKFASVKHIRDNKHSCWLEISFTDAMNGMIRKMFKVLGYEVITLVRTKIGAIELGDLPIGSWRELTKDEINLLYGGTVPSHFASEPTEIEMKIASGEIEVKNDKTIAKEKKAAAEAAKQPPAPEA